MMIIFSQNIVNNIKRCNDKVKGEIGEKVIKDSNI